MSYQADFPFDAISKVKFSCGIWRKNNLDDWIRCFIDRQMPVPLHTSRIDAITESPGAPLVIAHGLLGQSRNFGTLTRGFAEKRPVVTVDMRNHGDSPWHELMDYHAMADDLAAVIETHADGKAHLLGHSMGGKAAMVMALKRPELLASLVVADIAPVAYDHEYHKEIAAMLQVGLEGVSRRKQADQILQALIPQASMRAFLLQNLSVSDGVARWKPNLKVLDETMADITGWPPQASDAQFEGPTLFVKGGDSTYVLESHEPMIRNLFPSVEFRSVPEAGHWLHAERPKPFFEAVDRFLDPMTR